MVKEKQQEKEQDLEKGGVREGETARCARVGTDHRMSGFCPHDAEGHWPGTSHQSHTLEESLGGDGDQPGSCPSLKRPVAPFTVRGAPYDQDTLRLWNQSPGGQPGYNTHGHKPRVAGASRSSRKILMPSLRGHSATAVSKHRP